MKNKNKYILPKFSADAISKQGATWESDLEFARSRSAKVAWLVTGLFGLVAVVLGGTVAYMAPLKTIVMLPVYIDRNTGATEVINIQAQKVELNEIVQKHWAAQYVMERESYHYSLLQKQYDNILAWSSDKVGEPFAKIFEGEKRKDKVLGADIEEHVKIISVTIPSPGNNQIVVRYEITRRRAGSLEQLSPTRVMVANVAYEFKPAQTGSAADLMRNPLGFKVTSYRLDEELVTQTQGTEPKAGAQ